MSNLGPIGAVGYHITSTVHRSQWIFGQTRASDADFFQSFFVCTLSESDQVPSSIVDSKIERDSLQGLSETADPPGAAYGLTMAITACARTATTQAHALRN